MNNQTTYQANGYANRKAYLDELANEYGKHAVYSLATILGESEDFDGLVTSLEDYADMCNAEPVTHLID